MPRPSPLFGATMASMAAGPVFVTMYASGELYLQLPAPVIITAQDVVALLLAQAPAFLVGFFLAFGPNVLGSVVMERLAERSGAARHPGAWALSGAGCAAAFALPTDAPGAVVFALAATGAVCATLCRIWSVPAKGAVPRTARDA